MSGLLSILITILSFFSPNLAVGKNNLAVRVGSENFTESQILAEMMAELIREKTDYQVKMRHVMSGRKNLFFHEVKKGVIDIFPGFTADAYQKILKSSPRLMNDLQIYSLVKDQFSTQFELEWLMPLGSNRQLVMALTKKKAKELNVKEISDLQRYQEDLRIGVSPEYSNALDFVFKSYGFRPKHIRLLPFQLNLQALQKNQLDLVIAKKTDPLLDKSLSFLLKDPLKSFVPNIVAPVVREQTLQNFPEIKTVLNQLSFQVSFQEMRQLIRDVEKVGKTPSKVAEEFLKNKGLVGEKIKKNPYPKRDLSRHSVDGSLEKLGKLEMGGQASLGLWTYYLRHKQKVKSLLRQHLRLIFLSLILSLIMTLCFGPIFFQKNLIRKGLLMLCSLSEVAPFLAVLTLGVLVKGPGERTALVLVSFFAGLPMLKKCLLGLNEVNATALEVGMTIGLGRKEIFKWIRLPMALPTLIEGVRISMRRVLSYTTLGALVGAGGLGNLLLVGIRLNDRWQMFLGIVLLIGLGVIFELALTLTQFLLIPRGVRKMSPSLKI